jgi:hypothetical protein
MLELDHHRRKRIGDLLPAESQDESFHDLHTLRAMSCPGASEAAALVAWWDERRSLHGRAHCTGRDDDGRAETGAITSTPGLRPFYLWEWTGEETIEEEEDEDGN